MSAKILQSDPEGDYARAHGCDDGPVFLAIAWVFIMLVALISWGIGIFSTRSSRRRIGSEATAHVPSGLSVSGSTPEGRPNFQSWGCE